MMKLKGEAQKFPGMYIFDSIMRRTFGRSVKMVSYYGPVQMCVFGRRTGFSQMWK